MRLCKAGGSFSFNNCVCGCVYGCYAVYVSVYTTKRTNWSQKLENGKKPAAGGWFKLITILFLLINFIFNFRNFNEFSSLFFFLCRETDNTLFKFS